LNALLGGYEQILKRMISSNFNWFLHITSTNNQSRKKVGHRWMVMMIVVVMVLVLIGTDDVFKWFVVI